MHIIRLTENDPYVCLATEEFLLRNYSEEFFVVWQCDQTVVVGKHQNALGEVNYRYARENGIRVARRISGGGTVFHDAGNLNFAWFKNVAGPHEISFTHFTAPIIDALGKLGIVAGTSGRNDLLVEGKKISGNAEHVYKTRVLHHGTLLFDSDLKRLGDAIRVIPGRYAGKAVPSNRSTVANISGFLKHKMDLEDFTQFLINEMLSRDEENRMFEIPQGDLDQIRVLADKKFRTWEWQYGYSPAYIFDNTASGKETRLQVILGVEKGIIREALVSGEPLPPQKAARLSLSLQGKEHRYESVEETFRALNLPIDQDVIYSFF